MVNSHNFLYIFTAITSISLGTYVFFRNINSEINRAWYLLACSTFLWSLGVGLMLFAGSRSSAMFWGSVSHVGASLIPSTYLHFILALVRKTRSKKRLLFISYCLGILFAMLSFTHLLIRDFSPKLFFNYYFQPGLLYPVFIIMFFFTIGYALYLLFVSRKTASEILRNQLTYVAFASFLGFGGGATTFPLVYGIELYPFGGIVFLYNIIISFAILRYRLMDVRVAMTRAGIFAFVYALALGLPFAIGGIVKPLLYEVTSNWWLVPMFSLAILASVAPFIYMKLQKRIESRLRAQEFQSHEALRRLSRNMLRFTNLEGLLKLVVHHLVKILNLKFAAVYLLDSQANKYILKSYWRPQQSLDTSFEPPAEFSRNSSLAKDLYIRRLPIVTEELRLFAPNRASSHIRELISILLKLKSNIVIPSFLRNDVLGFLVLSDRRTNTAFTQEDLNLLMVLSNEAALAIENAQFHQKEKMVLMEKSRREALADMAPGASHQFNNRLVSISSSAELMLLKLEKIKTKKLKDEEVKTVLKEAKETLELIDKEVYKGKEITSAILRRAKAKVDFQKVDIKSLIENAHKLVQIGHSGSGIQKFKEPKFKMKPLTDVHDIFASEALLQDCFYNLIDNAFDAIRDAISKKVKPETHAGEIIVTLQQKDQIFTIQVSDNGIGLTKENQRKLFTPYFTTKATSGKGSGLGLYVIRDFIEMHKGTVGCDSEYGKGTTFTVKIPIKNNHETAKK